MSRVLAGVLAGCLVLAITSVAGAGIPDPTQSQIALDTQGVKPGLATCYAGDADPYEFIKVTAKRTDSTPIEAIPYSSFFFTVTGGDCTFTAQSAETDVNGEILFSVVADESIAHPDGPLVLGSPIEIGVQIYTVVLDGTVFLTCNTFDYDVSSTVDPIDFGKFGADYPVAVPYEERSDFNWDNAVDPIDFGKFGGHYDGPTHP